MSPDPASAGSSDLNLADLHASISVLRSIHADVHSADPARAARRELHLHAMPPVVIQHEPIDQPIVDRERHRDRDVRRRGD